MKYYRDIEIAVYSYNPYVDKRSKPIRTTHAVVFEDEDEVMKAEDVLFRLYRWKRGLHYEDMVITTMREHGEKKGLPLKEKIDYGFPEQEPNTSPAYANKIFNQESKTEMAKSKTEVKEESGVALFEQKVTAISFPEIPKVMTIGGVEFSEEAIQKEVESVKKVKLEVPLDTDTLDIVKAKRAKYEELKDKKNQFVKTRTGAENFRKSISAPIRKWTDSLKEQTDKYGEIAKEGQSYCEDQIKAYEAWEEEQERLRAEALVKLQKERLSKLIEIGGMFNPLTSVVSFEFAPGNVYNEEQLGNLEAAEFDKELAYISDLYSKDKAAKEAELQESQSKELALLEKQRKLRKKELVLNDFELDTATGLFTHESGVKITSMDIDKMSDDDWDAKIESVNNVGQVESKPLPVQTSVTDYSNPFGDDEQPEAPVDPLAGVISGMIEQHEEHQDKVDGKIKITLEFDSSNPYLDIMIGKSVLRVCPIELEDNWSLENDLILGANTHNGLLFTAFKGKK